MARRAKWPAFASRPRPSYDVTPGESFHPKGEANGYIVTLGGRRIYVVGVTECVPEIRAVKNIDVAFFPMNLPAARMEPDAAIECIKAINPKVVYPYHYDQVWVRPVPAGGTRPAPTTRGLQELVKALTPLKIEVRSGELVPAITCHDVNHGGHGAHGDTFQMPLLLSSTGV